MAQVKGVMIYVIEVPVIIIIIRVQIILILVTIISSFIARLVIMTTKTVSQRLAS